MHNMAPFVRVRMVADIIPNILTLSFWSCHLTGGIAVGIFVVLVLLPGIPIALIVLIRRSGDSCVCTVASYPADKKSEAQKAAWVRGQCILHI